MDLQLLGKVPVQYSDTRIMPADRLISIDNTPHEYRKNSLNPPSEIWR